MSLLQHQSTTAPTVRYAMITRYPGYRFGNDGSVWSCWSSGCRPRMTETWKQLKPTPQKSGHLLVYLGRRNPCHVHAVVLEAFDGPCPEGMECRHLDGDPSNNRESNLMWGTPFENGGDRILHGTSGAGESSPTASLTEHDVLEIVRRRQAGERIIDLAAIFHVHDRTIQAIMYGKSWTSVTGFPPYKPKSNQPGRRKHPHNLHNPTV